VGNLGGGFEMGVEFEVGVGVDAADITLLVFGIDEGVSTRTLILLQGLNGRDGVFVLNWIFLNAPLGFLTIG